MSNWERNAIQFVTGINQRSNSNGNTDLIPWCLLMLQELTGAYLALQVVPEDEYTSRIRNASPFFLEKMTLNGPAVREFATAQEGRIVFWRTMPPHKHVFSEILLALASAVVMPIAYEGATRLIVLGWSGIQPFDDSFRLFAQLVKTEIEKQVQQSAVLHELQADRQLFTTLLQAVPQALVFINANGTGGWVNEKAAVLLEIPAGKQEPAVLSAAMAALRGRLTNRESVDEQGTALFTTVGAVLTGWHWQFADAGYQVTTMPVEKDTLSGRLWVFDPLAD